MKIVVTVHDCGMASNVGGSVESQSAVIEIPQDRVPAIVREYFDAVRLANDRKGPSYLGISFSLLSEKP